MAVFDGELIARVMQKRDKTRVALRKSSCGAVMIDELPFTVSVESDGAENKKGVVFTLSGDAVESGQFKVDMIDVIYPTNTGTKTIKRKPDYVEKRDGGHVYRMNLPEIRIPPCADPESLTGTPRTEDDFVSTSKSQIIFRFVPHYSAESESEIMVNIYPSVNPLDGACTEWVTASSDKEFFEHGGFARIMKKGKHKI